MSETPLVRVRGLSVEYRSRSGAVPALREVDLLLEPGDLLGVVGESGSGKSTLSNALRRLLPRSCRVTSGSVEIGGVDVAGLDPSGLRALRRDVLGFIPQDPIGSLDPTLRIGRQLRLALRPLGRPGDREALAGLLRGVRIREPERVLRLYPHEISGGMAQRVAIALAMAREPRVLIADEPTAALDAQVREEVLDLMVRLIAGSGAALVWVSHDLRAVRRWCTRVMVMREGEVVEAGPTEDVFGRPAHPYTRRLLEALAMTPAGGERENA
ncbi:ABC transporter ATP-binding protein [Nonomuraea sp. NN258]|uniref:ABC transporter ATP-binding protein n=1 Tax=Nonomuraea antri TaxID=2730852 RepID=UPI0015683581|nr:ABC transporter ATP-binding protein [Nonomuraea antri]NRQ39478.1 ABC transporter ATP-binding protein [Nonomuraea antri]